MSAEGDSFPTQKKCPLRPLQEALTMEMETSKRTNRTKRTNFLPPMRARAKGLAKKMRRTA